jgi:hypothetical protein
MRLTDAKIFFVHLGEAIRHAEAIGAKTIDLTITTAQFDDEAQDELQRAINQANQRQSND